MQVEPVQLGTVGLGGYAGAILGLLEREAAAAKPAIRLVAVCEPDHETHAEKIASLRAAGVKVFQNYDEFLAADITAVWIPLPIDLHRPFTEKALAAGKAVLCEKPVAGSIQDADAMIAARDAAKLPVLIGYQDVYASTTHTMKQWIQDGRIGRVTSATVQACWPRHESYYSRAPWAGMRQREGRWILDSPPNNALAHYLNLPLFFMGDAMDRSASPVSIEAELYRVNDIENYDTACFRVAVEGGAKLLMLFTHACVEQRNPQIVIHGDAGKATWSREGLTLETADGTQRVPPHDDAQTNMVKQLAAHVHGTSLPEMCSATLETARAQVLVVSGASAGAKVHVLPVSLQDVQDTEFGKLHSIVGIEALFERCAAQQIMLHESGATWAKPAASFDLRDFQVLERTAD